jgi:hypothetical protein
MRTALTAAVLAAAVCSTAAWAGPFDGFKSKMKAGMYEYKMNMDMSQMPGMPPGMANQTHTFQHCVTPQDIERGEMSRQDRNNAPKSCEIKNMQISGNTATYQMVCSQPREMTADNKITFASDGYKMDMNMAMNQNGHPINMTQHMEAHYLGPCTK